MTDPRHATVLVLLAGVLLASACGPKRVAEPPPAKADLIVLLPGAADAGASGRVTVTNQSGQVVELNSAGEATQVAANRPPTPPAPINSAEVQRIFGAALAALPPPPRHFDLYFKFESNEVTNESRALVPEILKVVADRPVPEVSIVGHTDTAGSSASNYELGLKRATTIRAWLVAHGLNASLIEVASHGEADLLVKTPDNTPEPRNRRVEIAVR